MTFKEFLIEKEQPKITISPLVAKKIDDIVINITEKINDINTLCHFLDEQWEKWNKFNYLLYFLQSLQKNNKCEKLEYINSGSARMVYNFNDTYALKIAKNEKGLAQNDVESDWGLQNYGVAAELIKVSEDVTHKGIYGKLYIVSELCTKVKKSDFLKKEGISFENFCNCIKYAEYERGNSKINYSKPKIYDSLFDDEYSDKYTLFNNIYTYIGDYNVPSGDLTRLTNYGINKEGDIVLTDTGLNNEVNKMYHH